MRQQARAQRVLELRSRRRCSRLLRHGRRAENGLVRTPQVPTMAEIDFSAATATFLPTHVTGNTPQLNCVDTGWVWMMLRVLELLLVVWGRPLLTESH